MAPPPVGKTEQVSQHSIGDKFRNFFGSKAKQNKSKSVAKQKGCVDGEEDKCEVITKRCQDQGCLWEDPCFPACDDSLYFQEKPSVWPVEWKRPHVSRFPRASSIYNHGSQVSLTSLNPLEF